MADLAAALRELIGPIVAESVREALAEHTSAAEPPREVLTEQQVCELLQTSRPTLLKMDLPHVLVGDHRRYIRADVLEHLRTRPAAAPARERAA